MNRSINSKEHKVSVIIPTYQRPAYLEKCVEALASQNRIPDEIIIITRANDNLSIDKTKELSRNINIPILTSSVNDPGHLPPLIEGIKIHTGSIVCFLDDDCEAHKDWLKNLLANYTSDQIAGVGGRVVTLENGTEKEYSIAYKVGRINFFGKIQGNMYRKSIYNHPIKVSFFMGGNMSYRSNLLSKVEISMALNLDVAAHYEVDLGLQIKKMGYELVYDPLAKVDHYTAPRELGGMRTKDNESIYAYGHNKALIAMRNFPFFRKLASLTYLFLIGDKTSWGIASAAFETIFKFNFKWFKQIIPSFRGKIAGIKNYSKRI